MITTIEKHCTGLGTFKPKCPTLMEYPHVRGGVGAERWRWEDEEQVQFTEERDGRAEGAAVAKNVHPGDISRNHVRKDFQKRSCTGKTKA